MADGSYRFGAAHNFFQFPNSRSGLRSNSPPNGDMYPNNSQMRQQFGILQNLNKPFQQTHHNQTHNQHANHHQQQQQQHANPFTHHQQQHSIGGGLGDFQSNHGMHNGASNAFNAANAPSKHWKDQLAVAQEEREMMVNHPRARNAQDASRNHVANSTINHNEPEVQQRQRPGADATSSKAAKDQIWTKLDMAGQTLRLISIKVLDYTFLTELYLNNNRIQTIPPQIKKLRNLRMLDLSINQISSLPPEIGMLVNLRDLRLVDNQLEELPYELGNLFQCQMLALDGNPLREGYKEELLKQPKKSEKDSQSQKDQAILNEPDPPAERPWHQLEDEHIPDEEILKVLNYNTLCQHYCSPALYGYSPANALSWDHRKEVIMAELKASEADIMCLQEVEHDAYETYYRPSLAHLDYKGCFWPKSRAKTMHEIKAKTVDGCAIFYNNTKYILLDKRCLELSQLAINRPDMKGTQDVYNRVMPRDNIAVVCFFENRQTGARLIVVNAHLHWDHEYKDVKVVQVAILLQELQSLARDFCNIPALTEEAKRAFRFANGDHGENQPPQAPSPKPSMHYNDPLSIPLLVCGDFNSLPNSGPYELISQGQLAPNHDDIEGWNYGTFTRDGISHPFAFESAYSKIGELPFTNYVSNFMGVVDYMWYAKNSLSVRGLSGRVDPEYVSRVPGFPNVHFPSDHIALMAEFGFKKRVVPGGSKD